MPASREGQLVAQTQQQLGREAVRAAVCDALRHEIRLLQHQLVSAAQAEAPLKQTTSTLAEAAASAAFVRAALAEACAALL